MCVELITFNLDGVNKMLKWKLSGMLVLAYLSFSGAAQAVIIIDNSTGGHYNNLIGDMADYYDASHFPAANISEGDPTINPLSEPTTFGAAFGADWLAGDYSGGTWGTVSDVPNTWAINTETAIVYDFTLATASDLHIDLGVDNGIYVWLDEAFLFGAMAPGGASVSEYDIDLAGVISGDHSLQILREDHGGGTGYLIAVDATESSSSVPEPGTLTLFLLGLMGLSVVRKRV